MKLIDIIDNTPFRYGYRIAFLSNFFREPLLRQMEAEFGLIRPEWTVLICLTHENGIAQKDICEITEQPSNTVSRAVKTLVLKGHVERRSDPIDGRRDVLRITKTGRALYKQVVPMFVAGEEKMLACLSAKEKVQLDNILDKMCRSVPDWE